ncbi:MAG: cyclase family protein [Gammaproteobacteria bacterium]
MQTATGAQTALDYWPYRTFNWQRWPGPRGTLNLVDHAATARGVAAIASHQVISLGSALRADYVLGDTAYDCEYRHELLRAGKYDFGPSDEQLLESGDRISIATHGMTNSHIDAYCHVGHHGRCFNGERFEDVVTLAGGAVRYTMPELGGFATRGWFIDVPAGRGLTHLKPGDPVTPRDLQPFADRVEPGDALVIRTGRFAAPLVLPGTAEAEDDHGHWSGLHVECIDLIAEWDVATVATDGPGDNFPSTSPHCSVPVHVLCEVYLGLPLIHHLDLESMALAMATRTEKCFLFVVAPLVIEGGTGSPVSPTAIL